MARQKIKNFKVEQEELKPVTIGIFESRKKSSFGIFIILTVFILVVLFLPQISEYINNYLNPQEPDVTPGYKQEPVLPPDDPEEEEEETFYEFGSDTKIENEEITADSFVLDLDNNTVSFRIFNNSSLTSSLAGLNYYLELYSEEQTLLQRIKLTGDGTINSGGNVSLTKSINLDIASSVKLFKLSKKQISDYPVLSLNADDDGNANLVCSNNYQKVTYSFNDDELKEVTSELQYLATEFDYLEVLENYRTLSNSYNNKTGIVSLFNGSETTEALSVTTNVNLEEAKRTYIYDADTFSKDTEPKVVKFEMEAQGFTCSQP